MRIALLLALLILPAHADSISFEKLIAGTPVVDGVVNVYSPDSGIGQPDFTKDGDGESVKTATGIDIGTQTVHDERQLWRQVMLARRSWTGMRLIRTEKDIDACLKNRQFGMLLYAQVHFPLKGSPRPVEAWYAQGLRMLNLQYSSEDKNQSRAEKLGGAFDQKGGLTELGLHVVGACFVHGIMVDLSYCNEETTLQVAKLAKTRKLPVFKNHTATRGAVRKEGKRLADFERNASDKELKAIASTGGVVGIMAYAPYLRRGGKATIDDFVTHIEHAVKIAGIDHVGIATDGYLDGTMANNRRGDGLLDSPARWLELAKRLHKRAYTPESIKKLLGGNFLRAYRTVLK